MLRMLKVMKNNLAKGPSTVRLPGQVPPPPGLRGLVRMDPGRCLACGICAYVCVSDAITGSEEQGVYLWRYDPGRCTFCARCEERCPGQAISMEAEPAPPYRSAGALVVEVKVPFPQCPECGRPVRNTTEEWLNTAFAQADEGTRELLRLCVRCRRKRMQKALKDSMGGGR